MTDAALRALIRSRAARAADRPAPEPEPAPVRAAALAPGRPVEGRVTLPWFAAPVEIHTDAAGVPHVFAASRADLYRAQGLLHYAERRFQIELADRAARGCLAELLGPAAVRADQLAHRLGLPEVLDEAIRQPPAEVMAVFTWYAEGARCAAELVPQVEEYQRLDAVAQPPDAATALRTATAVHLLMGLGLQHDWVLALLQASITGRPGSGPDWAALLVALVRRHGDVLPSAGQGSNAWAATTADGTAVLAGDPHLDARLPGHWMAMHLVAPAVDVIGASLPGVPDITVGHNGKVAWATTFAPALASTLTVERLDGDQAVRSGDTEAVQSRTVSFAVAGAAEVTVETARTSRGRLLGLDLPADDGGRYDLALHCPAWNAPYDQRVLASVNTANSGAALAAALTGWQGVPQSVVFADSSGRLGRVETGTAVPGPVLTYGWSATAPPVGRSRHRRIDAETLVVAANNDTGAGAEDGNWEAPLRADRIRELLATGASAGVVASVRTQLDLFSPLAGQLLPVLLPALRGAPLTGDEEALARSLEQWHGRMYRDLTEPAIFVAWLRRLAGDAVRIRGDVLAAHFVGGKAWLTDWGLDLLRRHVHAVAQDPPAALASFRAALLGLGRQLGPERSGWTWGRWHSVVFAHPLAGTPGWAAPPRLALPGADDTVCRGDSNTPPRTSVSFRFVVDLAAPDESVWAFPVGNSGAAGSPHHTDQLESWAAGRYHRMVFSRGALMKSPRRLLTVLPATGAASSPTGTPSSAVSPARSVSS